MVLPNPYVIDAEAIHRGSTLRVLAHAATEGQEGVLLANALKVSALSSPGSSVLVAPGPYCILARHTGGEYESYIGKVPAAEQSPTISPVGSSGARTDLVYLRIENPYVPESTSWAQPPDPINGPYAYVRVLEGVDPNLSSVQAYNNTWSAIPLARITRPANTSVIQDAHIKDLRSTASLREVRIPDTTPPPSVPIPTNPPDDPGSPATPPMIAFEIYTRTVIIAQGDEHLQSQTSFHNFPNQAQWQVPVPAWATAADFTVWTNPQIQNGAVYGELRFNLDGLTSNAVPFDENPSGWVRPFSIVSGRIDIPFAKRGKVLVGKLEARSLATSGHPGKLIANTGTVATILINFRRISA